MSAIRFRVFSSSQCFGWYVCSETMPLQRDAIKPSVRQGFSGIRPGPGPLSSSQRLAMSIIDLMSVVAVRVLAAWVCLVRCRGLAHAQFNGIPCVCAGFACMDIWHLTPNGGAIGRARSAISANLSPPTKKILGSCQCELSLALWVQVVYTTHICVARRQMPPGPDFAVRLQVWKI